jgi:hypothetical protein
MAAFDQEEKLQGGRAAEQKTTSDRSVDKQKASFPNDQDKMMLEGIVGTMERMKAHQKATRDSIDKQLPNVLSLQDKQRVKISVELEMMSVWLKPSPDASTVSNLSKLSGLLQSDPKRVGPNAYKAQVQKLWKEIKAGIDPIFDPKLRLSEDGNVQTK